MWYYLGNGENQETEEIVFSNPDPWNILSHVSCCKINWDNARNHWICLLTLHLLKFYVNTALLFGWKASTGNSSCVDFEILDGMTNTVLLMLCMIWIHIFNIMPLPDPMLTFVNDSRRNTYQCTFYDSALSISHIILSRYFETASYCFQGPLFLTRFSFNPSMDK